MLSSVFDHPKFPLHQHSYYTGIGQHYQSLPIILYNLLAIPNYIKSGTNDCKSQNTYGRKYFLYSYTDPLMIKPKLLQARHSINLPNNTRPVKLTKNYLKRLKELFIPPAQRHFPDIYTLMHSCLILIFASHVDQKQLTMLLEDRSHISLLLLGTKSSLDCCAKVAFISKSNLYMNLLRNQPHNR